VYLIGALVLSLSLVSFRPGDPSFNTATSAIRAHNLIGRVGAHVADVLFQILGLGAWLLPVAILALGWKWVRSKPIEVPFVKAIGFFILLLGACTSFALVPGFYSVGGALPPGGLTGVLMAEILVGALNTTGAAFLTATCMFVSLYLVSSFQLGRLPIWLAGPIGWSQRQRSRWSRWKEARAMRRLAREKLKAERQKDKAVSRRQEIEPAPRMAEPRERPEAPPASHYHVPPSMDMDLPPWEDHAQRSHMPGFDHEREMEPEPPADSEIPICVLEEPEPLPPPPPAPAFAATEPLRTSTAAKSAPARREKIYFDIPSTALGEVQPSYQPGVKLTDLSQTLPSGIAAAIREALPAFARQIPGFDRADAVLTGVETRTSSPVRISRDPDTLQSLNVRGLYPGGEGAGYAGGILSAGVDGIRLAERVICDLLGETRSS
jgi:DNA segregation ATPase FtsK/SpoIIIE-like protein